jgi:hypothetical protein
VILPQPRLDRDEALAKVHKIAPAVPGDQSEIFRKG